MAVRNFHRTWYVAKTLLAGEPDRNQRNLYRGDAKLWEWNSKMAVWPVWKDEALQRVCDELNKLEENDGQ